jgi:hypothetical protein
MLLLLALIAAPSVGPAAPLPLTPEEASVLKAGAAATRNPAVRPGDIAEALKVARRLGSEGQPEALDLILAEDSASLLGVYLSGAVDPTQLESRLRDYYDKPVLATQLMRSMTSYASPETFHLMLNDLMPYADAKRHEALYCKVVTIMPRPDEKPTALNATLEPIGPRGMGVAAPNSAGTVQVPAPGMPGMYYVIRPRGQVWCRDEHDQWQVQRSYMSRSDIEVRDRRWAALGAISRTDLPGVETDLLKLVSQLSYTIPFETRGPEPGGAPIPLHRRSVPPLNILKMLGERGGEQVVQELTALLEVLISQGPPYGTAEIPPFAGMVAGMNTPRGSVAVQSVLVGLANSPETPQRNAAMESLIKPLGEVRPPAQVDLAALKARLMPLVSISDDKAKIGRAFDTAIHFNAGLRQPDADFAVDLLGNNGTPITQLRYVLERITDPNQKTAKGETILNAAAGNLEAQKLLLARGADPNMPGIRGFTALHSQVSFCRTDPQGARLLLAHGATVNAITTDDDRSTPLHIALACKADLVSRVLIDAGADVNAENRWGKRPLTIALDLRDEEMQALIRKRGGTESARDRDTRMAREAHITRRYSIRTVQRNDVRCDLSLLARASGTVAFRICERLTLRDADKIEVVSPREMRLTYFSGITLRDEKPLHANKIEPQKFTAVVRDREVAEIEWNLQVIDERDAGCAPGLVAYGHAPCWDHTVQLCENWGTHERYACTMNFYSVPQPTPRPSGKESAK